MLTNCDRTWKINYGFIEGKGKQKDDLTRQQDAECDRDNGDTHTRAHTGGIGDIQDSEDSEDSGRRPIANKANRSRSKTTSINHKLRVKQKAARTTVKAGKKDPGTGRV